MSQSKTIRPIGCLPIVGLLAAIGCALALYYFTVPKFLTAWQSATWLETEGTIQESYVRRHRDGSGRSYEAFVKYDYTLADSDQNHDRKQVMTQQTHSIGFKSATGFRSWPASIANQYQPGQRVSVYYNPANPKQAVLVKGVRWTVWLVLLTEVLVVFAGVSYFAFAFRKMQRGETEITRWESKQQGKKTGRLIFGALFTFGGVAYLGMQTIPSTVNAAQSYAWPAVDGKVTSAKVVSQTSTRTGRHTGGGTTYTANVEYEYRVQQKGYSNDILWFGDGYGTGWKSGWKAIVEDYTKNKQVKVYYHPSDPGVSVLQPGFQWSTLFHWVMGAGMLLIGVASLCYERIRKFKGRKANS